MSLLYDVAMTSGNRACVANPPTPTPTHTPHPISSLDTLTQRPHSLTPSPLLSRSVEPRIDFRSLYRSLGCWPVSIIQHDPPFPPNTPPSNPSNPSNALPDPVQTILSEQQVRRE